MSWTGQNGALPGSAPETLTPPEAPPKPARQKQAVPGTGHGTAIRMVPEKERAPRPSSQTKQPGTARQWSTTIARCRPTWCRTPGTSDMRPERTDQALAGGNGAAPSLCQARHLPQP